MHETFRFGRIAGVAVGMNWSVIVIAALVTWGLAGESLPVAYPGHADWEYWLVGVLAAGAFFVCLLAHELGHSLVARRHGVAVSAITLWMLGGVAKLEGTAAEASDELRIAAVGPAVSFGISIAAMSIAAEATLLGVPELVVAGFGWLATVNLILAVFNLMPAFPLDGGRILRAFLWRRWSDQLRATQVAASVGRRCGYGLVAVGMLASLAGAGASGIWLALIGLFITFASTAEAAQAETDLVLRGVRVDEAMTAAPVTVPWWLTVQALVDDYILRARVSAYPVVDEADRPLGLITLEQVRAVPAPARSSVEVRSVARSLDDVVTARPDELLASLLPRLANSPDGRALVIDRGRLVGIVSHTDVVRAIQVRRVASGPSPAPALVDSGAAARRPQP